MDESLPTLEVVLVDDGSIDRTAELMQEISYSDHRFQSVFLAKNYGHQIALSAGLSVCQGIEGVMVIDGDLQDPPELLNRFYDELKKGNEIVYGVRKIRDDEGWLKKKTSHWFYRMLNRLSSTTIPYDSGDFCMISRRAVNILNTMPEKKRFIRGMRAWIGLKQKGVPYDRDTRVAGETKYSFRKMIRLALDAVFGFSELPIKFMLRLGLLAIIIALAYFGYTLFRKIFFGDVMSGFTGILFSIILFSGVQLISIGILGEYIVRIFFQVSDRPLFIIKERIEHQQHIYG